MFNLFNTYKLYIYYIKTLIYLYNINVKMLYNIQNNLY